MKAKKLSHKFRNSRRLNKLLLTDLTINQTYVKMTLKLDIFKKNSHGVNGSLNSLCFSCWYMCVIQHCVPDFPELEGSTMARSLASFPLLFSHYSHCNNVDCLLCIHPGGNVINFHHVPASLCYSVDSLVLSVFPYNSDLP